MNRDFASLRWLEASCEFTVEFDVAELAADPGLMLYTYSAEPGSPSEDALRLLAVWVESNAHSLLP